MFLKFLKYIKKNIFYYLLIVFCIFLEILTIFVLIALIPYAISQLQGRVGPIFLQDFLGENLSKIIINQWHISNLNEGLSVEVQIKWLPKILILSGIIGGTAKFVQEYFLETIGEKIAVTLRSEIINCFLSLDFQTIQKIDPSQIAAMVSEDTREIRQTFTRMWGSIISQILFTCILFGWLFILNSQLFFLMLAVLVPSGLMIRITGKTLKKLSKQNLDSQQLVLIRLLERMKGWQSIKTFNAIRFEVKEFNKLNSLLYNINRRAIRMRAIASPTTEWLTLTAIAVILVVALKRISENTISMNILSGFLVTSGYIGSYLQSLTTQWASSKRGIAAFARIEEFLKLHKQPPVQKISSENPNIFKPEIKSLTINGQLSNETTYNNVIENVFVELKKSDILIIKGPSGSGKTTFIKNVLGIENKLNIVINDITMTENLFKNISDSIVFISQDPFIISGSILDNVTYPKKINDQNKTEIYKVYEALEKSNLKKDIFSTVQNLSGGERQRLLFARGFYQNAKLWIIDEGTSALDPYNEELLMGILKKLSPNTIIIIVAHRKQLENLGTQFLEIVKKPSQGIQ